MELCSVIYINCTFYVVELKIKKSKERQLRMNFIYVCLHSIQTKEENDTQNKSHALLTKQIIRDDITIANI